MENKYCSSSGQSVLDNSRFTSTDSLLLGIEGNYVIAPWTTSNRNYVDKTVSESVENTIYELAHNTANANDLNDIIHTPF